MPNPEPHPHLYEVTLSNGDKYDVNTRTHHSDVPEPSFRQHLLDIIKASASQIIAGVVVGYIHKGRGPLPPRSGR